MPRFSLRYYNRFFRAIFQERREVAQLVAQEREEDERDTPPRGFFFNAIRLYFFTALLSVHHIQYLALATPPTEQVKGARTPTPIPPDPSPLPLFLHYENISEGPETSSKYSTYELFDGGTPYFLPFGAVNKSSRAVVRHSAEGSSAKKSFAARRGQGKLRPRVKEFVYTTTTTSTTPSTTMFYSTEDYEYAEHDYRYRGKYLPKESSSTTDGSTYFTELITGLPPRGYPERNLPPPRATSVATWLPTSTDVSAESTTRRTIKTLQEATNSAEIWRAFEYRMNHMDGWEFSAVGIGGVLSFVTIVGNVLVMLAFKIDKQLQTISNYFILSLAVADLLIGAISMPLALIYMVANGWPMGPTVCDFWLSIDYMNSNASVLNLLLISFDRYFSITRPLTYRSHRTTRNTLIMIFLAWLLSILLWPPWIFTWPMIEGRRTVPLHQCYIPFLESNKVVTITTAMLAFWLPVFFMCILYWRIYRETEKRMKEITQFGMYAYPALSSAVRSRAKSSSKSSNKSSNGGTVKTHVHCPSCPRAHGAKVRMSVGQKLSDVPFELSRTSADTAVPVSIAPSNAGPLPTIFSTHDYVDEIVPVGMPPTDNLSTSTELRRREHSTVSTTESSTLAARPPIQATQSFWSRCCPWRQSAPSPAEAQKGCPACTYHRQIRRRRRRARKAQQMQQQQQQQQMQAAQQASTAESTATGTMVAPSQLTVHEMSVVSPKEASAGCVEDHPTGDGSLANGLAVNSGDITDDSDNSIYTIVIKLAQGSEETNGEPNASVKMMVNNGPAISGNGVTAAAIAAATITVPHSNGNGNVPKNIVVKDVLPSEAITSVSAPSTGPHNGSAPGSRRMTGISVGGDELTPLSDDEDLDDDCDLDDLSETDEADFEENEQTGHEADDESTEEHAQTCCYCFTRRRTRESTTNGPSLSSASFTSGQAVLRAHSASIQNKWDSKAAKTLSAILLAFIITWTPYNVLVILKTIDPRLVDSDGIWWQLSYYLCYINSTLNPVCYALCNHNFRRTYKRILTCGILGGKERTVHTNAIVANTKARAHGRTAYVNANFETQAQRARRLRQQAQQRFH